MGVLLVPSWLTLLAYALSVGESVFVDTSTVCATLDLKESSGWTEGGSMMKKFSYRVQVLNWKPFAHVILTWTVDVKIDNLFGATILRGEDGGRLLEVELGAMPSGDPTFTILGSGTTSLHPMITCSGNEEPPPSPPHPPDCELEPAFEIFNSWDEGAQIKITFKRWDEGRIMRLFFHDQDLDFFNAENCAIVSVVNAPMGVSSTTTLTLQLTATANGATAPTGCRRQLSEDTYDPDTDLLSCEIPVIALQLKPGPPHHTPKMECSLGGAAAVDHYRSADGTETLRVGVRPIVWGEGYILIVGFTGTGLSVSHVANAINVRNLGPDSQGLTKFAFELPAASAAGGDSTCSANAICFNAEGSSVRLRSFTCRPPIESPPPPSPPPVYKPPPPIMSPLRFSPPPSPPPDLFPVPVEYLPPLAGAALLLTFATIGIIISGRNKRRQRRVVPLARVAPGNGMVRVPSTDMACSVVSDSQSERCRESISERTARSKRSTSRSTKSSKSSKSSKSKSQKWKVEIELDDENYKISLPMSEAADWEELKEAICSACIDEVGEENMPQEWQEFKLETMAVQFLDKHEKPMTLKASTDFGLVRASRTLRVTRRRGAKSKSSRAHGGGAHI